MHESRTAQRLLRNIFREAQGGRTPFAKVSAKDNIWDDNDEIADADQTPKPSADVLATPSEQLATRSTNEKVSTKAESVTANLKVYQCDLEVAGLFVLPESELLISFKLLQPLCRVDRCTGRNYSNLHEEQMNVLRCRNRFKRAQRLHTSDGDKAQALAERILERRSKRDAQYVVPTFRAQCVTHRVYHVITCGMALFSNFVSGQIKCALSLRGPGNYSKFKQFLWTYLLPCHQYIVEDPAIGPGPAADRHRTAVFGVVFPKVRGRNQRRKRLHLWVVRRLTNGDIRKGKCFQHFCRDKCCKDHKDFLRKLRWFVAIVAGKMCRIFPRSRWTGMDESMDWIGLLSSIHNLLTEVYTLWYAHVTGRQAPPPPTDGLVGGPGDFKAILEEVGLPELIPDMECDDDDAPAHVAAKPADSDTHTGAAQEPKENEKTRNVAMRFVSIPTLSSITIGLRKACAPVFNMMHSTLDVGGARWDKLQYAKGAKGEPREYRATVAATCKHEGIAMQELRDLAYDATQWDVIIDRHRAVSFRNCHFKLISTFACAIKHRHTDIHPDCPWIASLWLMADTSLETQIQQRPLQGPSRALV